MAPHGSTQNKFLKCLNLGGWNTELLIELVGEAKTEEIFASKIMCKQGLNIYIWKPNEGFFTMASTWENIRMKRDTHEWIKWI